MHKVNVYLTPRIDRSTMLPWGIAVTGCNRDPVLASRSRVFSRCVVGVMNEILLVVMVMVMVAYEGVR